MIDNPTITPAHDEDFLYMQIAERLAGQIHRFVLKTGDKLPSVRALSQEQGISLSTAFKAYVELESMGMIEARPKSGYYVKILPARFSRAPEVKPPLKKIRQVNVSQMIAMIYENMQQEGVVRLSQSAPPTNLIPLAKLNKSMAEAIRKSPNGNISYENVQGNISLRKHIAKQAFSWGGSITENDVVTTQG